MPCTATAVFVVEETNKSSQRKGHTGTTAELDDTFNSDGGGQSNCKTEYKDDKVAPLRLSLRQMDQAKSRQMSFKGCEKCA
jgi:hypothetical protein